MNPDAEKFKAKLNKLLMAMGKSFSGIAIQCTRCDEFAFAKTPAIAETFGWSEVTPIEGAQYSGLCIDCSSKQIISQPDAPNNWIDVGSAPTDEPCAQVGSVAYHPHARRECQVYVRQLRRMFGPEPDGAQLVIHSNPHDFGTYLSVVCHYDPTKQASIDYAFRCENHSPEHWDEEARRELTQQEGGLS